MAAGSWITGSAGGSILTVKATPRASRDAVAGVEGDWLRVRLKAPPVDGKANAALVACLAGVLGLARRDVRIESGETGRIKRVAVALVPSEVRRRLGYSAS